MGRREESTDSFAFFNFPESLSALTILFLASHLYTAISKKVNSRYWNRKELRCSSSTYYKALTLQNIECRFTIMLQPHRDNLRGCVINHYDCTQSSFRFKYRLLTVTTILEIAVYIVFACSLLIPPPLDKNKETSTNHSDQQMSYLRINNLIVQF